MTESPKRRKGQRTRVTWPAVILSGSRRLPCTIIDVSRNGAKLQLPGDLPTNSYVLLVSDKFGSLDGYIVWRKGEFAGIRFTDPGAATSLRPFLRVGVEGTAPGIVKFGRRRST